MADQSSLLTHPNQSSTRSLSEPDNQVANRGWNSTFCEVRRAGWVERAQPILRAADFDRLETPLRVNELLGALDDAHLFRAGCRGALQHGEDRGGGVAQRVWRVLAQNARGDAERGEEIAGAIRADRKFWRAHAPRLCSFDGEAVDLACRRLSELGRGHDNSRWTARHQRLGLR